jgi:hypothetical protein
MKEFFQHFRGGGKYSCVINIFDIPQGCNCGKEIRDESKCFFIVFLSVVENYCEYNYEQIR